MLVQTNRLTKSFGGFTALQDCSLTLDEGVVFGLLGPNGAGKTTLLRLMLGFLFPTRGNATIDGFDCHRETVRVHQSLTYLPGDAQLFGSMKGRKVLKFFSQVRSDCHLADALSLAERLDLDLGRRVAFMSTGMRQKLALCVCLSTRAKLTILDEPTANLDPTVRGEVIRIVDEIKKEGRTVIFSSHVLSEIEDVCDRVVVMRQGHIVRDLDMGELKSRHRILCQTGQVGIEVPVELQSKVDLQQSGEQLQIDVGGDLAPVLSWMVGLSLSRVKVEPMGLRSVYDECHMMNNGTLPAKGDGAAASNVEAASTPTPLAEQESSLPDSKRGGAAK